MPVKPTHQRGNAAEIGADLGLDNAELILDGRLMPDGDGGRWNAMQPYSPEDAFGRGLRAGFGGDPWGVEFDWNDPDAAENADFGPSMAPEPETFDPAGLGHQTMPALTVENIRKMIAGLTAMINRRRRDVQEDKADLTRLIGKRAGYIRLLRSMTKRGSKVAVVGDAFPAVDDWLNQQVQYIGMMWRSATDRARAGAISEAEVEAQPYGEALTALGDAARAIQGAAGQLGETRQGVAQGQRYRLRALIPELRDLAALYLRHGLDADGQPLEATTVLPELPEVVSEGSARARFGAAAPMHVPVDTGDGVIQLSVASAVVAELVLNAAASIEEAANSIRDWAFQHQTVDSGHPVMPSGDVMKQLADNDLVQSGFKFGGGCGVAGCTVQGKHTHSQNLWHGKGGTYGWRIDIATPAPVWDGKTWVEQPPRPMIQATAPHTRQGHPLHREIPVHAAPRAVQAAWANVVKLPEPSLGAQTWASMTPAQLRVVRGKLAAVPPGRSVKGQRAKAIRRIDALLRAKTRQGALPLQARLPLHPVDPRGDYEVSVLRSDDYDPDGVDEALWWEQTQQGFGRRAR